MKHFLVHVKVLLNWMMPTKIIIYTFIGEYKLVIDLIDKI